MPKKDNDCWEARKLFEALRHDQRWVVDRLLELSTEVHRLPHGEPCDRGNSLGAYVSEIHGRKA